MDGEDAALSIARVMSMHRIAVSHCSGMDLRGSGVMRYHPLPVAMLPAEPSSTKPGRHVSKAARTSFSTRSYVWRGPHRGALALKKVSRLCLTCQLGDAHIVVEHETALSSSPVSYESGV